MKIIRSNRKTLALGVNRQGETEVRAPYWCSEGRILRFVEEHKDWLNRHLREYQPEKEYTASEVEELFQKAKAYIPKRVAYYAPLLGVTPSAVKITKARRRYGSCSSKNSLCFSLFLMEKNHRLIDYVVVHELAHILQHNHSPAFYQEIEKILPDYRERIKELKQ